MKPVDSAVNDENQDVHLLGKCIEESFQATENPPLKNVISTKKKTLTSRVLYDNVYNKKPIFRRKLIEKYSTARYNFNTKRIPSLSTYSKKKDKQFNVVDKSIQSERDFVSDVSSNKRDEDTSTNARFTLNGNIKNAVVTHDSATDHSTQSVLDTKKSTIVNSINCRLTFPKSVENCDEENKNSTNIRVSSKLTANCFTNKRTTRNASFHRNWDMFPVKDVHCEVSHVFEAKESAKTSNSVGVDSNLHVAGESSDKLLDAESSSNLKSDGSSLNVSEDSDSDEYLTISFDGDERDSLSPISSDEFFDDLCNSPRTTNIAEDAPCEKFHSSVSTSSAQDIYDHLPRNGKESTMKRPDSDSRQIVKNTEPHINVKGCNQSVTGLKLISDSDSDSGLQLCSSDGEKSYSDVQKHENQHIDFSPLLSGNVEKSHRQFSFDKTNSWVNNSSQKSSLLRPDSGTGEPSPASIRSAEGACISNATIDSDIFEPPSSLSNLVSEAADVSNPAVTLLSSDSDQVKTNEVNNKSEVICTDFENRMSDNNNEEDAYLRPYRFDTEDANNKIPCTGPVLLNQNLVCDETASIKNNEYKNEVETWKVVPSAIYQHLYEHYKTQKKEVPVPPTQKRKKKGQLKKLLSRRKHTPAKSTSENSCDTMYRNPYEDMGKELEMKEEVTKEDSATNIGMILHVGVNRPLFPEVYRNIISLNNQQNDGEITDFWANFALTTLITDKSSKRFRSVFLPVKDFRLKSAINEFQQKTSCQFQEIDLVKVKYAKPDKGDNTDDSPSEGITPKNRRLSEAPISSRKKRNNQTKRKFYEVDFPTSVAPSTNTGRWFSGTCSTNSRSASKNSPPVSDNSTRETKVLSDKELLAKYGFKPCQVLLPRIPIPHTNTNLEEDEGSEDEDHFFSADHCSRTYGQMFDYRLRNHSLVFFHRLKRILRLQKQNNKLFHSCCYVRLQSNVADTELEVVDVVHDCCPEPSIKSEMFLSEVTNNPWDILKTWKLNSFEAPLLKGIDVNTNVFPIRFMNHDLLKSETNTKWFILQLNKCVLNIIHHDKDYLPVELLFQIICRADLTKKVVCNTIGMDFDPNVLTFGVYGVPGLCEAVVVGPYESLETKHDLTASVQLWNGDKAVIPITETNFDQSTFFMWNEDSKARNVCGLWWKPGETVPCTSVANSAFVNYLFNPVESEPTAKDHIRIQPLLKQHPCLTYSRFERASRDINIRLLHHTPNASYPATGLKLSEQVALNNSTTGKSPLLQPTKLRSRAKKLNYCDLLSYKKRITSKKKSEFRKIPRMSVQPLERLRINTLNERMRRKEFSAHRSTLCSAVDSRQDSTLISILNKASSLIRFMEEDEKSLKSIKRNLHFIRKNLIGRLRSSLRHFTTDHPYFQKSIDLIANLPSCNQAEKFTLNDQATFTTNLCSGRDSNASVDSKPTRPIESRKKITHLTISKNSKLKCKPIVKKNNTWRNTVEPRVVKLSAIKPRMVKPRVASKAEPRRRISESSEICSTEEVLRSEHSYSKYLISRKRGRWPSNEIPEERPTSPFPSSVSVRYGPAPSASQHEHDQVSVYLTENGLPITKLVIQRLKSMKESNRHLPAQERRNQIIALIRNMVAESLARARRSTSDSGPTEESVLVPRLLLLQRLLENANMQIRNSSMVRDSDEPIEISDDDDDDDEFCIESATGDVSDPDADKRIYVKVLPAKDLPTPYRHGIVSSNLDPALNSAGSQAEHDATNVINEQLSVENQVILNSAGDQVSFRNYMDDVTPLSPPPPPSTAKRGSAASAGGQRKITLLKRVNGVVPSDSNADADSSESAVPPKQADVNQQADRNQEAKVVGAPPRRNYLVKTPNGGYKLLRTLQVLSAVHVPSASSAAAAPAAPPKVRMMAKKTFSSPNYRKFIATRRAQMAALKTGMGASVPEVTDPLAFATESSADLPAIAAAAESPSHSIGDYTNILPTLLRKPISPRKPVVTKFQPNILTRSSGCSKADARNVIVVPLNRKKVPWSQPVGARLPTAERLRCPSFVPHLFPSPPPSNVALDEVATSPLGQDAGSQLLDDRAQTRAADDDTTSCVENGSWPNEEQSTSRRSSISVDSSIRLAVKSFASVRSFDDTCFTNMDKLLNSNS